MREVDDALDYMKEEFKRRMAKCKEKQVCVCAVAAPPCRGGRLSAVWAYTGGVPSEAGADEGDGVAVREIYTGTHRCACFGCAVSLRGPRAQENDAKRTSAEKRIRAEQAEVKLKMVRGPRCSAALCACE